MLGLFITAFIACLALARAGGKKYFLQFTDLHMEDNYKPGSDVDKRCVAGTGDAPQIGYVGCDLSDKTIQMYLEEVAKMYPDPEFVMYSGDSNPHYLDYGYASNYTKDDVLYYAKKGLKIVHDAFPNVPYIPVIGNHDNYPSDQLSVFDEGMEHLRTLGSYFADYIDDSQVETLTTKGYYVKDMGSDMRIIVMTTVYCNLINFYATLSGGERDLGMFDAVDEELQKARQDGKYVLMALHRPAGIHESSTWFDDFLPLCRNKLGNLYEKYQDIMTYGSFTGHTHKNSFRLFTTSYGKPIHVQYVSLPLTSYNAQQPGSTVFYYDEDKHITTDVIELYLDLDESNKQGKIVIKAFPSFIEQYGISDMTAESMYEVFKTNVKSKTSAQIKDYYDRLVGNYSGKPRMTNKVWAEVACGSGPVDHTLYKACLEKLEKGNPYTPPY